MDATPDPPPLPSSVVQLSALPPTPTPFNLDVFNCFHRGTFLIGQVNQVRLLHSHLLLNRAVTWPTTAASLASAPARSRSLRSRETRCAVKPVLSPTPTPPHPRVYLLQNYVSLSGCTTPHINLTSLSWLGSTRSPGRFP